jgi:hypothetical protein
VPLSTFLGAHDPFQSRGLMWLALSETGTLLAASSTSDSGGGASESWVAAGTFPCRIDPLGSGNSRVTGGQINEQSTHVVTVMAGAAVTEQNRFAIAGRGTFDVLAVRQRTGEISTVFEVIPAS